MYSGDHAPLEYIALHSIVLQCTVYSPDDVNVVMIKYEIQIGLMLYKNSISSLSVIF